MSPPEAMIPEVARLLAGHLDEGEEYATWRSRGTPDWLLVHTIAGRGRFGTSTGHLAAHPGDSHLLTPGTLHDYATAVGSDHWEILFAHFHPRPDWIPLLRWPEAAPGIGYLHSEGATEREIQRNLLLAVRFHRSVLDQHELFAINAFEAALLWCHTQRPATRRIDERVQQAVALVDEHLDEPLGLHRLAAASALSVSRFAHLFRLEMGTSPARFVERQRMNRARQLLELSAWPVAIIATKVGYKDPLYFSTRFHRYAGMSPTSYRDQARRKDCLD